MSVPTSNLRSAPTVPRQSAPLVPSMTVLGYANPKRSQDPPVVTGLGQELEDGSGSSFTVRLAVRRRQHPVAITRTES